MSDLAQAPSGAAPSKPTSTPADLACDAAYEAGWGLFLDGFPTPPKATEGPEAAAWRGWQNANAHYARQKGWTKN